MRLLPLSKSRFSTFVRCAFYASMVYERGVRPPRNKKGAVGVLLHKLRQDVQTGQTTMDDALSVIKEEEDRHALVQSIALDSFTPQASDIKWEWDLRINAKGLPVRSRGILRGILDRVIWMQASAGKPHVLVEDVKFGKWWYDDEFERRSYVLLLLPHIDPAQDVSFLRTWPKLGQIDEWTYRRTSSFYRVIEGDGETEAPVDLWDYLQTCVMAAANAEPVPQPGAHCENWFGAPCYFLSNFCPISKELPINISPEVSVMKQDIHHLINSVDVVSLPKDLVASAYAGALQLQGMLAMITDRVKEWTKANGDLQIGGTQYGWSDRIQHSVDKEFVLREMLDRGLPVDVIAKTVNVSHSSLNKLPRAYAELKGHLLALGTREDEVRQVFGGKHG